MSSVLGVYILGVGWGGVGGGRKGDRSYPQAPVSEIGKQGSKLHT